MGGSTTSAGKTFLAIFLALALLLFLLRSNAAAPQLTVSWNYDYSDFPACTASVATHCIDHFEIQDISVPGSFKVLQSVPNSHKSETHAAQFVTSLKFGPFLHNSTVAVVAVGRDENGDRTSSNPYAARATLSRKFGSKISVEF